MQGDLRAADARHAGSGFLECVMCASTESTLPILGKEAFGTKPNFSNYVLQACIQAGLARQVC